MNSWEVNNYHEETSTTIWQARLVTPFYFLTFLFSTSVCFNSQERSIHVDIASSLSALQPVWDDIFAMTMMVKRKFTHAGKIFMLENEQITAVTEYLIKLPRNLLKCTFCLHFRYCTDTRTIFTTSVMLKNHISLMHGIKNPDLSQMLKTAIKESKKAFGKVVIYNSFNTNDKTIPESTNQMLRSILIIIFKACGFCDLQGSLSERPAVDTQVKGKDGTRNLEAPPAKRVKTQFRCSKCGFVTDDGPQFQQHIPQHKTDENTPQCLHCGLCFTSSLSLNKHLFIVHKVKDTEGPKRRGEEDEAEVRETVQFNQPVRSADTDEVDDLSPQLNEPEPSRAGEPAGPHCDKTSGGHLKASTHTPTQAVSLR